MSIVNASETQIAFVAESVAGTTPATPVFQKARYTGGGMQVIQDFVTSNEIRPDRQLTDRVRVGRRTEGSYNIEMSYGSYDALLEGLLQNTWSTNVLENGIAKKFFTIEELYEAGTTDQYKRLSGVQVNTMSLSMAANQLMTGSIGLMGFGTPEIAQAIVTGATYTDPNDNPVLSASNDFASLTITGLTSPKIQSLDISINNNLRKQPVIGSIDPVGMGSGRFEVSGSITMYFENEDAYEAFLENEYTDLAFSIGGASELKYDFSIPKIKFLAASIEAAGNDTDVPITLEFGAVLDADDGHTIEITRTPAA